MAHKGTSGRARRPGPGDGTFAQEASRESIHCDAGCVRNVRGLRGEAEVRGLYGVKRKLSAVIAPVLLD
jgi:hypothetical protein